MSRILRVGVMAVCLAAAMFGQAALQGQQATTFEKTKSYPEGIPYTIVNGVVVIDNGKHTGARPGQPLFGRGHKNRGL